MINIVAQPTAQSQFLHVWSPRLTKLTFIFYPIKLDVSHNSHSPRLLSHQRHVACGVSGSAECNMVQKLRILTGYFESASKFMTITAVGLEEYGG